MVAWADGRYLPPILALAEGGCFFLAHHAHRRRFDAVVVWQSFLRALETFKAQGIEFVSFSEQMDTSTSGRQKLKN